MYRAALLGCGPRAKDHAIAYAPIRTGSLSACCDMDPARLGEFAGRFEIPHRYKDFGTMLEAGPYDLLHIVTPPTVRLSVIEQALAKPPKAILLEKPLANRPEEGYRIINICRERGVHLFLNHQMRFHTPWIRLREVVRSGSLGAIEHVRASCRGNILGQGTHLFDLLAFLWDDQLNPEWVLAQASGADHFADTHSTARYVVGVIATRAGWHVSFECGPEAPVWPGPEFFWHNIGLVIQGREGSAGCSSNKGWWVRTRERETAEDFDYNKEDTLAETRLIESVFEALSDPSGHPNNAAKSQGSFDLVMAALRSALLRERVDPAVHATDREVERLRAQLEEQKSST